MNSNIQKKSGNRMSRRKNSNQTQSCRQKRKDNKMTSSERAEFADMNQIEWFPVDQNSSNAFGNSIFSIPLI